MIGLCCFSLQVFLSSITFGYKSCILVRFLSIFSTKSEFTSLFILSSKHGSKVSTIQERKTGEERLNKHARFSWDCNWASQRILFAKKSTWSYPWSETKKTTFGAHLWMYFSSVHRYCFKLFLFSTALLNITFLKMGFIVVQWENKNSMSVVNEKKVVGAMELKEGTINSWHID